MNASCANWWMFAPSRADLMKVVCLPGLTVMSALNGILFVMSMLEEISWLGVHWLPNFLVGSALASQII